MDIHIVAKDKLEADGIRWVIESHLTSIRVIVWDTIDDLMNGMEVQPRSFAILDMDHLENEQEQFGDFIKYKGIHWLGISSERIFQTVYRALRCHAKDVFFRPFSPMDLVKHIQQFRYQIRNKSHYFSGKMIDGIESLSIDYADLFFTEQLPRNRIIMAAFLTPNATTLPFVFDELQQYSFTGKNRIFALTDFILCVQEVDETNDMKQEYQGFLTHWKERMEEQLAIVIKQSTAKDSFKETYQQTRQLTRQIFFEGYDIILVENSPLLYREMDPLLTPLEQRQWIEMLEERDMKAIREWVENEFLTYEQPYPDPEIVRIRLTSVLAQVRRHMKSYESEGSSLEAIYYKVFQQIIHQPVIYQILKELLTFIDHLLTQTHGKYNGESRTLVEKIRELIEAHYWDPQWNLAACAETVRMNKSTLSRRFAMESGETFRTVLHKVRLTEAKRLLKETDLPIEKIARLVGYVQQTYFNTKFKQYEGITPSAYRYGLK